MQTKLYKNKSEELEARIVALEAKKAIQYQVLKAELNTTYQQLRPSSLLYRALTDINKEPKVKDNLVESIVSIVGGYLSKKVIMGKSNNIFKNILGYAFQYISTKIISKKIKQYQ